jgi:catabolite regulation protein CreA
MGNSKSIGIAYSDQDIIGAQYIFSDEQLGYTTAAQGVVTQLTDKSTAVTLNKSAGRITMNNASLASNTAVTFQLNNNLISPSDAIILNVSGGGTAGAYTSYVSNMTDGSAQLSLRNLSASPLSEAVILNYAIVHGQ